MQQLMCGRQSKPRGGAQTLKQRDVTCSASRTKAAENCDNCFYEEKLDYIKNNGGIMLIGLSIRVDQ